MDNNKVKVKKKLNEFQLAGIITVFIIVFAVLSYIFHLGKLISAILLFSILIGLIYGFILTIICVFKAF